MWNFWRRRRRRKLIAAPLPESWAGTMNAYVYGFDEFRESIRHAIEDRVKVLVAERTFEGCDGLDVTDEMKVAIASQAALMLLGTEGYYFDSVTSVLIFPDVIERYHDGVVTHAVGEAWDVGNVVLSWPQVEFLSNDPDGSNVVIHEFAHHLDGLDGEMGGSIHFPNRNDAAEWERVASREFDRLVAEVRRGRRTTLDPYGATNRAEFFAVASETFFECPEELREEHPQLYDLLKRFYAVDPESWECDRT